MAYTTIDDPSAHFHVNLHTGDGEASLAITNDANAGDFSPDWLWIKNRTSGGGAGPNVVFDTTRGNTKDLHTNNTETEHTNSTVLLSFDTDGFTVGASGVVNEDGSNFVAWQWKANGGSTSSNTSGSITSTVQANTTSGFSIVTWTGDENSSATLGHGLGAVPKMIITKGRTYASSWSTYHNKTTADYFLQMCETDAAADVATIWNDTEPTSTLFTVGSSNQVNDDYTYVAYVFAEIQGFSKFGSYTGNNDADGTFVYTGFKPAWVMIKRTSDTENWVLWDNKRDPFNNFYHVLLPNATSVEDTSNTGSGGRYIGDFLSNGFKLRNTHDTSNSASDYVYAAFAEQPFVTSGGVPCTAR